MTDITVLTTMYVVLNMGIIYYGVFQLKLWYVIQEIYLFLLHTFHVLLDYINTCFVFMNFVSSQFMNTIQNPLWECYAVPLMRLT